MNPALAIDALTFDYGSTPLLRDYALTIEPGRHKLLLGASGSGKSTVVQLICGMMTPIAGRIVIGGETMTGRSSAVRDDLRRRRIGIIFQTLRLVSALDVRGNLMLAQQLSGAPRDTERVDALLEAVGIAHRSHARPRELSQGEAQRAAIARALVGAPDLLVADEPTSALDDVSMAMVTRLLIDTADATGATLLIATHDARLRDYIPDVVAL